MDSYEHNTCSFIVKIWLEETEEGMEQPPWRGHITHVYSGRRCYVEDFDVITDFIAQYLTEMKTKIKVTHSN
ncbi:MAG: hypothetical protein R3E79_10805 [Caldilineaceae bacterium]